MSKLSEKSLKILEYYTILDQLAEKCVSRKAKQAARNLRPLHDIEDVQELLTQTDDAKRLLTTGGTPAFGGIREVSAALSRSKMAAFCPRANCWTLHRCCTPPIRCASTARAADNGVHNVD